MILFIWPALGLRCAIYPRIFQAVISALGTQAYRNRTIEDAYSSYCGHSCMEDVDLVGHMERFYASFLRYCSPHYRMRLYVPEA